MTYQSDLRQQQEGAASRVAERLEERRQRIEVLREPGGIARADSPERIATRIDRLSHYHPDVRPVSPSAVAADEPAAMAAAGVVLERVIGTEDFLGVAYLQAGAASARSVGRVNIRDDRGRLAGYGTGFMVSPELMLTNHHVLSDEGVARTSTVEFDYQDGPDGRPLPPRVFPLDPGRFFLADSELDFGLVAVTWEAGELGPFGFNPLIEAEGKAIVGEPVTVVQHPRGGKKQVALRENRLVDLLDLHLHYETDTELGSSGSPVFNDQWEVVALHHASVPVEGDGYINEGIRVSRLARFIHERSLLPAQRALADSIFAEGTHAHKEAVATSRPAPAGSEARSLRVVGPIEVLLGSAEMLSPAPAHTQEAVTIDPDYGSRQGYDPEFLGSGSLSVPLPALPEELVLSAALNALATTEPRYVLPYHHFSVVLNKDRGLAFFTAANIDGASSFRLKRESDKWSFDPRVPEEEQTGEAVYVGNPLDRGHLVRRLDPAWGTSPEAAKIANDDTFHFTNCTPQHEDFNQNRTTWAGLEDYILENADNRDFRASVFTGPVLAPEDEAFEGVLLPRQFWKVAVMVRKSGELSATAYLLSQEHLIRGLEIAPEEFSYGAYETFQVTVRQIEALTGLSFGALTDSDPLARLETVGAARQVTKLGEIEL